MDRTTLLAELLVRVCGVLRTHEMLIFELGVSAAAVKCLLDDNPQLADRFRELLGSERTGLSQHSAHQLDLIDDIAGLVQKLI
jgi:hypothetical protein